MESFIQSLLQSIDHPIHFFAEILLFFCLIYLYTTKSYKSVDESLSKNEEEELIAEWNPEPLVSKEAIECAANQPISRSIEGTAGPHVTIGGVDYLNVASNGFLGYQFHPEIIETAIESTNKYGVGACGPRGFYGSIAPHMQLEYKIAQFMGCEEAIIFSSDFQTIASVIPAFAKPGDFLICDKGVSFAIQNGILLSRSLVKWFDHNDMHDLERVLQSLSEVFQRAKHRVFLLVESIYSNHGDIINLKTVLELKQKYPFRIILEESLSIGVLGKTGRGITEHLGIPCSQVDIITCSLGNSLGSVGGFAAGTTAMGRHMRLNCSGYVFSCSSPPFLSQSAIHAFNLLEKGVEIQQLQKNIKVFHRTIKKLKIKELATPSSELSPYIHFRLTKSTGNRNSDEKILQNLIEGMFERKIVVAQSKYSPREIFLPEPSLKISISALHTEKEIIQVVECLVEVATEKLKKKMVK